MIAFSSFLQLKHFIHSCFFFLINTVFLEGAVTKASGFHGECADTRKVADSTALAKGLPSAMGLEDTFCSSAASIG